jgi:sulfate adenylyltransferase large subunit
MTVRPDPSAFAFESFLAPQERKSLLRFVVCGSVDHGKSTLVGRLLYEAKLLFQDQLDALTVGRVGARDDEFDFSLLLDGLAAEREQKITIDVAYRFFTTEKRKFIVADAPGHEQYTRNMATGASTADLALILVNAASGLTSQTKRHSLIVSTLGVRHLAVAVNKMDLVDWSQAAFARIEADFRSFAADLDVADIVFIPVSARSGDNVVTRSARMDWYRGPTLLEHLEQAEIVADNEQPFRMPIQWVNRPHADFRGYCGLIASGEVYAGMPVQIWPSGRMVHVDSIVTAGGEADLAVAGESVTLTFEEQVDASRGDMLGEAGAAPLVGDRLSARVVWMGDAPLSPDRSYLLKAATSTAQATAEAAMQVIDLDSRQARSSDRIVSNEIGTCVLKLDRRVSVDRYSANRATGGFVLLDPETYDTIGIGIVEAADSFQGREANPAAVSGQRLINGLLGRASESRLRSAAKAFTWRIIASLTAFAIALALTGSVGFAGSVALLDMIGRTTLYYLHERMWSKIAWGTHRSSPPAAGTC